MSKPVTVTLRFRNREQRDYFMGQLSDGWGENHVELHWRGDFDKASTFTVDPTVDTELWEHHKRMKQFDREVMRDYKRLNRLVMMFEKRSKKSTR